MNERFDPKEIDHVLRHALRPVDPGEDFTQSVMSHLPQQNAAPPQRFLTRGRWLAAAMAASIVAAAVITLQIHERQERAAGLRARQEVLEALQVTSEKLNVAYRVVRDQSRTREVGTDDSGA